MADAFAGHFTTTLLLFTTAFLLQHGTFTLRQGANPRRKVGFKPALFSRTINMYVYYRGVKVLFLAG